MAVVDKSENKEAIKATEAEQNKLDQEFLNELTGVQADKEEVKEKEEKPEDEETEEQADENDAETEEQEDDSEEAEENESDEEESPTATQKRINKLTAEKKLLEAKLAKLEGNKSTESTQTDPDLVRLEKMTLSELKTTKNEIRLALRAEKDDQKARRLIELEDKIDATIQSAPQRFESNQLSQYQAAVRDTAEELGEQFTDAVQAKIFNKAKLIFEKAPSLRNAVEGQATAWSLAVDWYKDTSKLSQKADRSTELERDINKLKKKVSLDTAVTKGANKESENSRLFNRAKKGDRAAENKWIKEELGL